MGTRKKLENHQEKNENSTRTKYFTSEIAKLSVKKKKNVKTAQNGMRQRLHNNRNETDGMKKSEEKRRSEHYLFTKALAENGSAKCFFFFFVFAFQVESDFT